MSNQNKNILNILKYKYISFFIIFIFLLISSLGFIAVASIFNILSDGEININIKVIILAIFILFVIINIISYKINISRVKYFLNATPIECVIEDFIVIKNGKNSKPEDISYTLYPVVKVNNQLFFTYDYYCINGWSQSYIKTPNAFNIAIFRKDKSKVNIGDKAYLYIKKDVNVKVDINVEKNTIKLNSGIYYFYNFNKNYDINIMKNIKFFEGIIDIEKLD